MHPALHDDDRDLAQEASDNAARVALDGGLWKMRNLGVGNGDRIGDHVGHSAQPGAEDDSGPGTERTQLDAEERSGFGDLVVVGHFLRQTMCFRHSTGKSFLCALPSSLSAG